MELLWDVFLDAAVDCVKMLPFLFLAFFLIELLEQKAAGKMNRALQKAGAWGPLAGAGLGLVPQCGFSVLASNFFAGGLITMGTLLAVYLSTSDEALVIMLTEPGHIKDILPLLLSKLIIAVVAGYIIYAVEITVGKGRRGKRRQMEPESRETEAGAVSPPNAEGERLCSCGCGCGQPVTTEAAGEKATGEKAEGEEKNRRSAWKKALYPAFRRTEEIFIYLFIVTFVLNLLIELVGLENLSRVLLTGTPFEPLVAVFIGLIPNCAASVILTQLYFEGILSFGAAIGGLCAGAGLGLLVLFRVEKNLKKSLLVLGLLFCISVIAGSVLTLVLG